MFFFNENLYYVWEFIRKCENIVEWIEWKGIKKKKMECNYDVFIFTFWRV